ncbi:hypothetical protein FBEOM_6381 [Fusarium beomiforme]|uniref:F-box domain-containing protein n=1 Tax=Fusarium beomiforme TaxID=44412 RepID=A0A9P5DWE9_9HYPO|nr:hypothetical protein FBEOM_6381 [Fusarium beomiforme]
MVFLSDMPDETLERIFEFVTNDRESLETVSLVNRRFNKIVFPLLVCQWSNSQECCEPCIERFSLHLLRNPHLRKQVGRLDLGYLRPLHDHDPDSADLSTESLAALATTAKRDLSVSSFLSTHLSHRIRLGCEDAVAVLILAWATRLSDLHITIPSLCPEIRQHFMPLLYAKEAICRLLDEPAEMTKYLPLGQVRHVTLQHWNREEIFGMRYARVFFHLPNIESICTHGMYDDFEEEFEDSDVDLTATASDDYTLPFPVGTSTVRKIIITRAGSLKTGLLDFISACRTLKKLVIHVDQNLANYHMPDEKDLAEAIMQHKDSLEELDLDMNYYVSLRGDDVLKETYRHLPHLWSLAVSITDLFEMVPSVGGEDDIKIVLDRIPRDIQVLMPHNYGFIYSWISHDVFMEPYLEGIIELLEETGPEGRFSKLRILDLSRTFVHDPAMVDIKKIKELAISRRVKVMLHGK